VVLRYDYGLFKVLVTGSFLVIFFIFSGIKGLAARLAPRRSSAWALCCAGLFLALGYRVRSDQRVELPLRFLPSMKPYVELGKMTPTLGGAPISLCCSNDFNQEWAIYFLKDYPVEITRQRGYMAQPHLLARMQRSKPIPGPIRYLLTDGSRVDAIWHNQKFWLIAH
jgi:hypothetical protein